ncbi:MAG: hypothetical protein ACJAYJ_003168 [Saprospiraceae bacterium]|jgi:hypothetical protein
MLISPIKAGLMLNSPYFLKTRNFENVFKEVSKKSGGKI